MVRKSPLRHLVEIDSSAISCVIHHLLRSDTGGGGNGPSRCNDPQTTAHLAQQITDQSAARATLPRSQCKTNENKSKIRFERPMFWIEDDVRKTVVGRNGTHTPSLPLWRDISSHNENNSSSNSQLLYSFLTDTKQSLATSYMASKGHCCLCQFTAINNDLDVLIKHLSYCHPRFTASLRVRRRCSFDPTASTMTSIDLEKQRSSQY